MVLKKGYYGTHFGGAAAGVFEAGKTSFGSIDHGNTYSGHPVGFAAGIAGLDDTGTAVVLVEQFASLALAIGDRAYVLRRGGVFYEGVCDALAGDPERLHHLYLGDAPADQAA